MGVRVVGQWHDDTPQPLALTTDRATLKSITGGHYYNNNNNNMPSNLHVKICSSDIKFTNLLGEREMHFEFFFLNYYYT